MLHAMSPLSLSCNNETSHDTRRGVYPRASGSGCREPQVAGPVGSTTFAGVAMLQRSQRTSRPQGRDRFGDRGSANVELQQRCERSNGATKPPERSHRP